MDFALTNVVGEIIMFVVEGVGVGTGAPGINEGTDGVAAAAIAVRTEVFVVRRRVADISGNRIEATQKKYYAQG